MTHLSYYYYFAAALSTRSWFTSAFTASHTAASWRFSGCRLQMISNSAEAATIGISRIETLRNLLRKHGAPGSRSCMEAVDLEAVDLDEVVMDLHPFLVPIARSKSSGNYVCALRRASLEEEQSGSPWPIVEGGLRSPGVRLLALNSEHLMRRIACEADHLKQSTEDIVSLYNQDLGSGSIKDKGLDVPYETGSVEKLGYGLEKYILLRVGPFPDLYEIMSRQHAAKGDEQSSLVAAEACNSKFVGFASTFAYHAKLLDSFPNREDEARDVARICLRLPLYTMGLTQEDFCEVSRLAQLASPDDTEDEAMLKLQEMYEKIRQHELEQNEDAETGKTLQQKALDEATYLMDTTSLTGGGWADIRSRLGDIYAEAGLNDIAKFVDPDRS